MDDPSGDADELFGSMQNDFCVMWTTIFILK